MKTTKMHFNKNFSLKKLSLMQRLAVFLSLRHHMPYSQISFIKNLDISIFKKIKLFGLQKSFFLSQNKNKN